MKLTGAMLGSEQPKVLGEFYTNVFGKAGWEQGDWFGYNVGGGTLMIGPHSEVKGQNDAPARIMITLVADDVKKEFTGMVDKGAKVVAEPYQPNAKESPDTWLATVADPDGNYLQISTPWEQ